MGYYPVFLNLKGKRCLVVGGGRVALRKIKVLLKQDAKVSVVSPSVVDGIKRLLEEGKIELRLRRFRKSDLSGAFLVIAATNNRALNREIYNNFHGLINVVDDPELCNFIVPSSIERGDLIIAISTSGISPGLSRSIRMELKNLYPPHFAKYLKYLKKIRGEIIKRLPPDSRRKILKELGSKKIIERLRKDGINGIKEAINYRLKEICGKSNPLD